MAKKAKEEDVFFVGIKDPIEIRRSVLESSKDFLHYLARFEKFKTIRNKKAEDIAKLREITGEITKLINRLKADLPKTKLRAKIPEKAEEPVIKTEKIAKKVIKKKKAKKTKPRPVKHRPAEKKPMTDLEKLEAELGAIESRLSRIS